jgi:hypothetical protein
VRVFREFFGAVEITAAGAQVKLAEVADEVIAHLRSDPNARVKIILEIEAEFPQGVSDQVRRTVSENASALGFKTKVWE